ncbi:hypothetical protein BDV26DRAFT_275702, partial [Aspergillus bertholletiae]
MEYTTQQGPTQRAKATGVIFVRAIVITAHGTIELGLVSGWMGLTRVPARLSILGLSG